MSPLSELLKVNSDLKLDIRLPAELNLDSTTCKQNRKSLYGYQSGVKQ